MWYVFTLRVRLLLIGIPFAMIPANVAWRMMLFGQWPGPVPADYTGLMFVAALGGFTLFLAAVGTAGCCAVLALQQIILNLVYYRDTAFREAVMRTLSGNPPEVWQMYDGVLCFSAIPSMPTSLFLHRMDLMVRRGLVETKRFSPSIWRSYRNVPAYRLASE